MPTDVAAPLPQADLRDLTIVTVTLDDPAAIITQLVVHGWQELPRGPLTLPVPKLTLEPGFGGPGGT
jgi:hypothetical protein